MQYKQVGCFLVEITFNSVHLLFGHFIIKLVVMLSW